jgi:hypothetical protein
MCHLRYRGAHGRDKAPVRLGRLRGRGTKCRLRDLRALVNPRADQLDLLKRQGVAAERHPGETARSGHAFVEGTGVRAPRRHNLSRVSTGQ